MKTIIHVESAQVTLSPPTATAAIRWTKRPGQLTPPRGKGNRKPTLAQLDKWFSDNYDQVLALAEENCLRLTGKRHL